MVSSEDTYGKDWHLFLLFVGAEGAMVPKTLRQTDRRRMRLWKVDAVD